MGEQTKIEWTDHTFNAWIGCEKISPGCKNCYAAVDTYARVSASRGLPLWGPGSSRHVTSEANWRKPLAWDRAAKRDGVRRRVFCSSLSDVFEDRPELLVQRARLAMLIANTPSLDWLLLTKRPENAARLWDLAWGGGLRPEGARIWLPNIWLGATCEDQKHYDERWPHLAQVPARVRFISHEPALGPVTLICNGCGHDVAAHRAPDQGGCSAWFPDCVITGGESGSGARPYEIEWARSLIKQTRGVPIACFVKQLGAKPALQPVSTEDELFVSMPLRHPKGGDWSEWPEDLRVREWPEVRS